MIVKFDDEIVWDGAGLIRWATVNGSRIQFRIPRDRIHRIPIYNDLIEREIALYRFDIFDRLQAELLAPLDVPQGR